MKPFRNLPLRLLILSVVAALFLMSGVTPASAALGIISVQPNKVSTVSSVDLVITGTDFADGAVVLLENFGALNTTFVSSTVLRAVLPVGLAPGTYTISVINPDSSTASLPNALTVSAPTPTSEPSVEVTPTPFSRPLVVIESYKASVGEVSAGATFNLVIKLSNIGKRAASNLVATFTAGDFIPAETGGMVAVNSLDAGDKRKIEQPLTATYDILGKTAATITMNLAYTDSNGTAYSESFTISLPVAQFRGTIRPTATTTPTPTAPPVARPLLVISSYETDVNLLQPGTKFSLNLRIKNAGNAAARRVTMILGGGSASSGNTSGTPDVGGVSGASGDFGNFAPVNASNVQFLGDLDVGAVMQADASLIVNASANPGAYPMKISFTHSNGSNAVFVDDQVITLLIYSLPQVDVNFYRDPGPLSAGQPNQLPLQVVNLGRKTSVLGNMQVSSQAGQLNNNVSLVGALDPGGYFTLDAMFIPDQPGPADLQVRIDYTDDFNNSQVITKTIAVDVMEAPVIEPGMDGGIPPEGGVPSPTPEQPETFWQKVGRFLKGLLGLDSAKPTPGPGELPPGEIPPAESPGGPKSVPPAKG